MELHFYSLNYKEVLKFYYTVFHENSFPFLENLIVYLGINYGKKEKYFLNKKNSIKMLLEKQI